MKSNQHPFPPRQDHKEFNNQTLALLGVMVGMIVKVMALVLAKIMLALMDDGTASGVAPELFASSLPSNDRACTQCDRHDSHVSRCICSQLLRKTLGLNKHTR
jgi:hypothetical protein